MLLIVRGGHVTVNRIGAVGGKSDLMCVWLMEGWTENISGGWGGGGRRRDCACVVW